MSQSPHASASTSLVGKTSDVITNSSDFFVIGLEDDCIFTPKNKKVYEKLLNEEAFIRNLFEKRSLCINEYEVAKDIYKESLRNNQVYNGRAYLLDDAIRNLDKKRKELYEIDAKLNEEISTQSAVSNEEIAPQDSAKPVSKIGTAGKNLKEIIVARKDGGTRKTLVRSNEMANHFRRYQLKTTADLGKGSKSFIKNNKIDWNEFKSNYQASKISWTLKSENPWIGEWIKSCNKDIVMLKYAGACNTEIDLGISMQFDFSGEAQFLRAATSLSWTNEYDLKKGKLSTKIDGGVYATLAEAKSTASFSAPRDGMTVWLGSDICLGVVRFSVIVTGSAGAGAAIAGSLFVDIDASKKTIAKLPSTISSIRSTEPGKVADLSGLPDAKAGVSGSAFIGVSVDASIAGAFQWKSPEVVNSKENEFKTLASIKPGLSATAGVGAELDYYIDFADGMFRIFCKAALCIGIGAKGNIGFEVDTNQIGNFMICAYHQICSSRFVTCTVRAVTALTMLSLSCLESEIKNIYDMTAKWYGDALTAWEDENKRIEIMKNIIKNPDILKYTLPSAKGILVHFLIDSAWWAKAFPSNNFDSWIDVRKGSNPRKRAIILIFTWVQSKEEFREIMRNIKENVKYSNIPWQEGFNKVQDFLGDGEWFSFGAPYTGSAYGWNFEQLYNHLHEKHPVGYPVVKNNMEEYLTRSEISPGFIYPILNDRSEFREKMLAQAKAYHSENIG